MSLPIPLLDAHPSVQQAMDFIAERFPLGKRDLSNEVLNGYLKLGTAADLKLTYGSVANVFAGNLGANATGTWTPAPGDVGLTSIAATVLGLVPQTTATGVRVLVQDVTAHSMQVLNGATAQQFTGTYIAIGS